MAVSLRANIRDVFAVILRNEATKDLLFDLL